MKPNAITPGRKFVCVAMCAMVLLAGCETIPQSYRVRSDWAAQTSGIGIPQVAPLHVEVYELSAGGVSEKRDDWTETVRKLATDTTAAQTGYLPAPRPDDEALTPEIAAELKEVTAMLQVIALNHIIHGAAPGTLSTAKKPIDYNVGRIDDILDALKVEGILVVFVRDEYSTGGRKALMALGILAGAATGVMIVPRGGFTINTAALVARDGSVLWFNFAGSGGDMRTPDGARATIAKLLAGLPELGETPVVKRGG